MRHDITLFLVLCSLFLIMGCKKENLDYTYDYRTNPEATKASNVRLINLSLNKQLTVNGDSLTNFFLPPLRPGAPPEESTYPGTKYFPENGLLSTIWNIPQNLFQTDGKARIITSYLGHDPVITEDVEILTNADQQPKDYYLLVGNSGLTIGGTPYLEVPREVSTPSRADHFKIRVLNLSLKLPSNNPMEDIASAYTLAFADGTPVSAATSNVQEASWSNYTEVPYGTYQFKILTADGRQVPAEGQLSYSGYINPALSTIVTTDGGGNSTSGQVFAPVQTFQPGGVYTIVIHPARFTWNNGMDDLHNYQNSFRIIPDIKEPENNNFARVQLANAFPQSNLQLHIKSAATETTAYGQASTYQNVIAGRQTLEVRGADGQVLVSQQTDLQPGGNYTLWIHPNANNTMETVLMSNNLSGTWYNGYNNDGGNAALDRVRSSYFFNLRFVNLCPDIPYATFTNGQGIPYDNKIDNTGINLQPGLPRLLDPYTRLTYDQGESYRLMVYASSPNKVPGDWMPSIAPISSQERLVARPELYTKVNRKVPAHEPGIYTVALVGRQSTGAAVSATKLMIVKHTK